MSGSRQYSAERRLAEQHLGDRLSALVDGELGHETRERVLAHLATCAKCKAEADAQRRLKSVFAEMAPPPPSESFLARLQGLPGGGDSDSGGSPLGGGGFADGLSGFPGGPGAGSGIGSGVFGMRGEGFRYVPARPHASVLPPAPGRGFRIHDVGRHDADRSSSRGLRFAFAAAGAVSLAAIALGGVSTGVPGDTTDARGTSGGSNVTPMRPQGGGTSTAPDSQRRRSAGPLFSQGLGQRTFEQKPVASTEASAPLLPGVPAPPDGRRERAAMHPLTTPVLAAAAVLSPLIRPQDALASWSTASEAAVHGLLMAPAPDSYPAPSPSTSDTVR